MGLGPRKPLVLAFAALLQTWSGYWDVYSHSFVFKQDPPLNPAHVALVASSLLALWLSWRLYSEDTAFRLPLIGALVSLGSGAWNELQHRLIGEIEPISPPHAAYVTGLLVTQLGLVLALAKGRREGLREGLKWALAALWLTGSGSALYVAGLLSSLASTAALALLDALPTLILVPSALSALGRTGLLLSSAFYAANALPLLALGTARLPWFALLPVPPLGGLALDACAGLLRGRQRAAGALLGLLAALLSPALYYPFSLRIMPLNPVLYLLASVAGMGAGYASLVIARLLFQRATLNPGHEGQI
jgi:hypothetical protein